MSETFTVLRLIREIYTPFSTCGRIEGVPGLEIYTLEPPDLNNDGIPNNEKNASCIPEDWYIAKWLGVHGGRENVWSITRKNGLAIPGRNGILIHSGNTPDHTSGCLLLGNFRKDNFVGGSRSTLTKFAEAMNRQSFILQISNSRKGERT